MNSNRDSYNKICEQWNEYRNKSIINTCIVEFEKKLGSQAKILDVGCGTGYPIADYLVNRGHIVTGIDVSEKMIEKAVERALPNAKFLVKDLLEFSTAETFDAVIAFDSVWHIEKSRQRDIYKIITDLLNVGGYFLFTHGKSNGNIRGQMFGEEFYYSALNVNEVHQLLGENGFEIIQSIEDYKEETTGDRELLVVARKK